MIRKLPLLFAFMLTGAAMAAPLMHWPDLLNRPQPRPDTSIAYGADPLQHVDLWLPKTAGKHPVVLMVHGGCWQTEIAKADIMNWIADDLRMGLYRRMNEIEDKGGIESFAAEMIDRFGPLPEATTNLLSILETKLNAKKACVAKLDVGARGALVTFFQDQFPDLPGLLGYVERLKGTAKLRPDNKLVITRNWPDAASQLHGALQLSKGLAKILA